ncbi:MAG: hypothetical protein CL878_10565 [Dehalococcoidia bacterium]|nr:hypothetical protein [Dehalococcoidia bacterium]
MRILVVGAGGLGTLYGAFLTLAGAEVAILVKPGHLDQLHAQGSRLMVEGVRTADAEATPVTSGEQVGAVDWLLLTVKSKDTGAALAAAAGCKPGAAISLQNGIVKDRWLRDAFGPEAVVGASTTFGATYLGVGHARFTFPATTWLGEIGGGTSARVNDFADLLTSAKLAGQAVEDIEAIEWWKLCYLLPGAMIAALARTDYGTMFSHPLLAERFLRLTQELIVVARAGGVAVADPPEAPLPVVALADGSRGDALTGLQHHGERYRAAGQRVVPSLAQDALAHRRTEIEYLAGEVLRRADEQGIDVPVMDTCYRLLRGLEDSFDESG